MKRYKKYLLFNLSFFVFHLLIQYFFNKWIQFNYLTLIFEFILFSFMSYRFLFAKNDFVIILYSLSNLIIYIFFIWVIEKSLSIDLLLHMYEQGYPLTIEEISNANNLYDMTSFRINQVKSASVVLYDGSKYQLSNIGKVFTMFLSFLRNLYF